jgi:hypothetical protein
VWSGPKPHVHVGGPPADAPIKPIARSSCGMCRWRPTRANSPWEALCIHLLYRPQLGQDVPRALGSLAILRSSGHTTCLSSHAVVGQVVGGVREFLCLYRAA